MEEVLQSSRKVRASICQLLDMKMVQVFKLEGLTNQHIIEQMFQDIITNGKDPWRLPRDAENN